MLVYSFKPNEPKNVPSSATTDTDDGDGRAGDADRDGSVLDNDADRSEELGSSIAVRSLDALAALHGGGVALAGRGSAVATSGCGDREGDEREDGEFVEHG
jgi:hypothetical protein